MSSVQTEHVLVVPTELFHEIGHFQGFCTDATPYLERLLQGPHVSYRPRGEMEEDPSFKQLIPYVVIQWEHPDQGIRLFQYTRGSGQGESRLHAKRSIGVGGHISSDDAAAGDDPYFEGLRRELQEEVRCTGGLTWPNAGLPVAGLINDDETEVGRVHLGVVHCWKVAAPEIEPREADLLDAGFVATSDLLADLDRFETWSQITLQALYGR